MIAKFSGPNVTIIGQIEIRNSTVTISISLVCGHTKFSNDDCVSCVFVCVEQLLALSSRRSVPVQQSVFFPSVIIIYLIHVNAHCLFVRYSQSHVFFLFYSNANNEAVDISRITTCIQNILRVYFAGHSLHTIRISTQLAPFIACISLDVCEECVY